MKRNVNAMKKTQSTKESDIQGGPKWHIFWYALTNIITKDPTTPQVCRYTTL